jgi:hypothetical protein
MANDSVDGRFNPINEQFKAFSVTPFRASVGKQSCQRAAAVQMPVFTPQIR